MVRADRRFEREERGEGPRGESGVDEERGCGGGLRFESETDDEDRLGSIPSGFGEDELLSGGMKVTDIARRKVLQRRPQA